MADIEKNTADVAEKAVKSEKKADKPAKAKKAPLGKRISAWFRAFKAEFKKIVWVSPKNVLINTIIVLVVVIVVAAVIALLDLAFSNAIRGLGDLI